MTTIYKINDNNTLSIYCLKPNYREIEQYKRNIIKRRGIEFFDFETDLFEKSVKLDSEREMDILFPALECNNYIYDFFGKLRVAARVR